MWAYCLCSKPVNCAKLGAIKAIINCIVFFRIIQRLPSPLFLHGDVAPLGKELSAKWKVNLRSLTNIHDGGSSHITHGRGEEEKRVETLARVHLWFRSTPIVAK